jgi:hypothetical protein
MQEDVMEDKERPFAKEALDRYKEVLDRFLNTPGLVEKMVRDGFLATYNTGDIILHLAEAVQREFTPISLGRYEEMSDEDRQMLRDMGIEP